LFTAEVKARGSGPTVEREASLLLFLSHHGYRVLDIRSAAGGCLDRRSDQHAEAPSPTTQER
jgi:hypothetical protein